MSMAAVLVYIVNQSINQFINQSADADWVRVRIRVVIELV